MKKMSVRNRISFETVTLLNNTLTIRVGTGHVLYVDSFCQLLHVHGIASTSRCSREVVRGGDGLLYHHKEIAPTG